MQRGERGGYSAPLVNVAVWSVALGVAVMVVAVCVLRGFQGEIRRKAVGFGAHIVVKSYAMGNTYEETPVDMRPRAWSMCSFLPTREGW